MPTIKKIDLNGTRPKIIRTILVKKIKMAVEKLDNMTKKQVMPTWIRMTKITPKLYALWSACRVENIFAKLIVRQSFAISEGMKLINPRSIQRLAPPLFSPKKKATRMRIQEKIRKILLYLVTRR